VSTVDELFIKGTQPTHKDNLHVPVDIDAATGLLWQDGCTGPKVTHTYLDFSQAEPGQSTWQPYTQEWAARAARGVGVRGGPKKTRTMYFYNLSFHPNGATWGGKFKPTGTCSALVPCPPADASPTPQPSTIVPCVTPQPTATPSESHGGPPTPGPTPSKGGGKPTPTPKVTPKPTAAAAQAAIPPAATLPLVLPLLGMVATRRFRPARRPSRHHRPRRARPPEPS
jgi:hypothetical protein